MGVASRRGATAGYTQKPKITPERSVEAVAKWNGSPLGPVRLNYAVPPLSDTSGLAERSHQ